MPARRSTPRRAAALAGAAFALMLATPAIASDDSTPPQWKRDARVESLATAPEPPRRVAICVIDTGVNLTPDTAPVIQARLADDGGTPDDVWPARDGMPAGHGTHVATFAAGPVNGWGASGVWPHARIVSVRAFSPGEEQARAYVYTRAIETCRQQQDVKVITFSIGAPAGAVGELSELRSRIELVRRHRDINVVVAAGNGGSDVEFPGTVPEAFTVAAVREDGGYCAFSARGTSVDIVAPGCGLASADRDGAPAVFAGTSYGVPQVAAVLTVLRAYRGMSADEAERQVLESARPVFAGRLLDGQSAVIAAGLEDRPQSVEATPKRSESFADLPTPRGRAIYRASRRVLVVDVRNRPDASALELKWRGRRAERAQKHVVLRCRTFPRQLRMRYISDDGVSRWVRVRARRL